MAMSQTNPFPGLRPFREDEEHLFFGRENQVDVMVNKLADTQLLAVLGTSGSGKSSLVNCGLRPALRQGLMTRAGTTWRIAQFRPGNDPIGAMACALAQDGVLFHGYTGAGLTLAEIIETTLRLSKLGLIDIYEQATLDKSVNLLVVVDQFEELFRYRGLAAARRGNGEGTSQEATAFVNLLLEVKRQIGRVFVVLTMRSDFLGDCTQFPGLAEAINAGLYLVPRMSRDDRRAAIEGPVRVGGAEIAPVLLTRLVNDVGDNPDQLSILQHALNRTWACWQSEGGGRTSPLDVGHYEAVGTMVHALDHHAEQAYTELSTPRQKQVSEKLFKALTDKATDPRGVRRPTTFGELCSLADAAPAEVADVIAVFRDPTRSFLMPPAAEALKTETVIDVSHESLMRVWRRLIKWADEEAQSARTYRRLAETADLYAAGNANLWRDPELQLGLNWREESQPNETWASRYHPGFAGAMHFLTESREQREAERAARARQRQREREAEQEKTAAQARYAQRMRWAALFSAALALLAMVFGAMALWAKQDARRELQKALTTQARFLVELSRQQRVAGDGGTAVALAIEALTDEAGAQVQPDMRKGELALDEAWRSLHERIIFGGHSGAVNSVAFGHDMIVTASEDHTARLWNARTGESIGKPFEDPNQLLDAEFSPDGTLIVTASADHKARVWDVKSHKQIVDPLTGHMDYVYHAAFSPDGKLIVTASGDHTARLWDAKTGKPIGKPLIGHENGVVSAMFSRDSAWIVTASLDHTAQLWDGKTGAPIGKPLRGQDQVWDAEFSPDSKLIVTASGDSTAQVWDAKTCEPIGEPLRGHKNFVKSAAFSPDGKLIVTASGDYTARLWDAKTGAPIGEPLRGHQNGVASAMFSPDSKFIVTASGDRTARLWAVETGKPMAELRGHENAVNGAAFSPDSKRVVTASSDDLARLWDAQNGKSIAELKGHKKALNSAVFSPDGKRIVTASADHTARLWNAETGKSIAELRGHEDAVNGAAFSSDGTRVVTASGDYTARLWDGETGTLITALRGHKGSVNSAAFSPDGNLIVTASSDKTAQLWDAKTGKPIGKPLEGHESDLTGAAFSPDGTRVVTASWDWRARLWDAKTGQPIGEPLTGHKEGVVSVAFSPDGKRVVTASADHTARLWDPGTGTAVAELSGHTDYVNSVAFSPDSKRVATASADHTARLWDAETGAPIGEPLEGHSEEVVGVAFSPNGNVIVTTSRDWTARLWDAKTGKPISAERFGSIEEFLAKAMSVTPRCLTAAQRNEFFLAPEPPIWCMGKWPSN
jgi:WD40 repeat protein